MLAHAHNLEGAKANVLRDEYVISSSDLDLDH